MNRRIKKKRTKAVNKYKDIDLVFNNKTIYQKLKICKKFFIGLDHVVESRVNISYDEKLRLRRYNRQGAGNMARGWFIYAIAYPNKNNIPLQIGQKLTSRYGNKSVISVITSD